jgi:hypothetical protein
VCIRRRQPLIDLAPGLHTIGRLPHRYCDGGGRTKLSRRDGMTRPNLPSTFDSADPIDIVALQ